MSLSQRWLGAICLPFQLLSLCLCVPCVPSPPVVRRLGSRHGTGTEATTLLVTPPPFAQQQQQHYNANIYWYNCNHYNTRITTITPLYLHHPIPWTCSSEKHRDRQGENTNIQRPNRLHRGILILKPHIVRNSTLNNQMPKLNSFLPPKKRRQKNIHRHKHYLPTINAFCFQLQASPWNLTRPRTPKQALQLTGSPLPLTHRSNTGEQGATSKVFLQKLPHISATSKILLNKPKNWRLFAMISNCLLHIILATKYHKINPKILKVVGGGKYRLRPADVRVPSPHLGSIRPSTGQAVSFCFHPFFNFPIFIGLEITPDSLFLSYRHRPADWAVPPLGIDTSVYGPLFPANAPPFAFLGLQLEK